MLLRVIIHIVGGCSGWNVFCLQSTWRESVTVQQPAGGPDWVHASHPSECAFLSVCCCPESSHFSVLRGKAIYTITLAELEWLPVVAKISLSWHGLATPGWSASFIGPAGNSCLPFTHRFVFLFVVCLFFSSFMNSFTWRNQPELHEHCVPLWAVNLSPGWKVAIDDNFHCLLNRSQHFPQYLITLRWAVLSQTIDWGMWSPQVHGSGLQYKLWGAPLLQD